MKARLRLYLLDEQHIFCNKVAAAAIWDECARAMLVDAIHELGEELLKQSWTVSCNQGVCRSLRAPHEGC